MQPSRLCVVAVFALSSAGAQPIDDGSASAIVAGADALRAEAGVQTLREDPALSRAARDFARFMAREGRYGHQADGRTPAMRATAAGYGFCSLAENIAWASGPGTTGERGGRRFVDGWSRSPGHRANLLDPNAIETGVGVARGADRVYAVQLFGRPETARIVFEVRNALDRTARYRLDEREWTLGPGATRRHERCEAAWIETGATRRAAENGVRYVVERDGRDVPTLRPEPR